MSVDCKDGEDDRLMAGTPVDATIIQMSQNNATKDSCFESKISISFHDLLYTIPSKGKEKSRKEILRFINGQFRCRCLNAIIGPSGAGKTSLLNIICGLKDMKKDVSGNILINGRQATSDNLRKIACYIPQDFAMLPMLTTRETLYFAAKLKIPNADLHKINAVVTDIATKLGLDSCLSTMTQNLSGGEKKRLSIGSEIVVNPRVLVLDEPTSGLDSASSIQVMTLLKNISESGCTIICSVHQPSSQLMTFFDEVLVMADGRELYCGPRDKIVDTFAEAKFSCPSYYSIAEYALEVATGQHDGNLDALRECSRKFQLSIASDKIPLPHCETNGTQTQVTMNNGKILKDYCLRSFNEFRLLMWRSVKCILRDNTLTRLRLAAHVIVGIFMGIVFYDCGNDGNKVLTNIACLFFCLLFLFFSNSMPAVQMFPNEAAVFAREYMNNWYGLGTYYTTKVLTDLPLQVLCPTSFLIITYWLTGQPLELDRFLESWLICFLLCILAQSFGMLTGAACGTHAGTFSVPALNIPMCVFAGFFLKLNEIPVYLKPLSAISYFRYAFEGIMLAIYGGKKQILNCFGSFCYFGTSDKVLKHLNMPSILYSTAIYALLAWIAFLHICIYSILRWKSKRLA